MTSVNKSSFPNLAASSSLFDTKFSGQADLTTKTMQKIQSQTMVGTRGNAKEFFPTPSRGGALQPLTELSAQRPFKQVSYRFSGDHPASTGTSKTDVPCLTNGLGPCTAVMLTGASPDGTARKARLFHVSPANSKAGDTVADYKKYLVANGLTDIFAVLAGGDVNPAGYKAQGMDDARAQHSAQNTRVAIDSLRQRLGAEGVRIAKDDAGDKRPNFMTGSSNVGFELKNREGQIKFSYLKNAVFR
jgi:hypothetical protein